MLGLTFTMPVDAGVGHTRSGSSSRSSYHSSNRSSSGSSYSGSNRSSYYSNSTGGFRLSGNSSDYSSVSESDDVTTSALAGVIPFILAVSFIVTLTQIIFKPNWDNFGSKDEEPDYEPTYTNPTPSNKIREVDEIKMIYPGFDENDFISYVNKLYLDLQVAWMNKDWEKVRDLETSGLFETHERQLQDYIRSNTTNVLEKISIENSVIRRFDVGDKFDVVTVYLSSYLRDYVIDDKTGDIVEGNRWLDLFTVYKLEFLREKDSVLAADDYSSWKLNIYEVVDEDDFYR